MTKTWSSQNQRQFGIDKPVRLDIQSSAEETFLAMLELGIADGQLETAAKLAGLPMDAATGMVERLQDVIEDFNPPLASSEIGNLPTPMFQSFQKRQRSVVYVPALDRFGKLIVHSLAHSGIGKIIVGDSTLIGESDCGRLGYRREQIGVSKLSVVRSEIANTASSIKLDNRMRWKDYAEVDVALVVSSGAFKPADYQRWLSLTRRHLGVCFSDNHVLVTSVIDENTACLGCRELNRWEQDQSRRMVCGQIAGATGLRDSISLLFASGLSAQSVLRAIDGGEPGSDVQFWSNGEILNLSEKINQGCGCRQLPEEIG